MSSLEALRRLRVLVVHPDDADGGAITQHLRRIGCQVETLWPPTVEFPAGRDVVFYLVNDQTRGSLPWHAVRPNAAIVAIVDRDAPDVLGLLSDSSPHAVLGKPAEPFGILTSLTVARNIFRYEERLYTKVRKLEETLRSVRKVEQAKTILMRTKKIEEQEAYEYLRRHAMNRSLPIGKVASAVIDAEDMLS